MSDIFATERSAQDRRFAVSDSASRRIAALLAGEPGGSRLRVTVSGGSSYS
jgi:hypothetical protein